MKGKVKADQSCPTLCDSHELHSQWNSPGQNTGVGSLSLLHGSNPGPPHCRQILYQLNHERSPRILEWVAISFSSRSRTQESNQGLLHCRQILYQVSYQESQRELTEGGKKGNNTKGLWEKCKRCNLCLIGILGEERKEQKKYFKQ